MNAEIVAVGSELLTQNRLDTNSLWLTGRLNRLGIEVTAKTVVGDDRERLAEALHGALQRACLVLVTGGLGPTEDDVTREAVAQALGRELEYHEEICEAIEARFRRGNRQMAEINRRQAYVIEGFQALENPNGTAPGQWGLVEPGKAVALLPGPPNELQPMFTTYCEPRLARLAPPQAIATAEMRVAGIAESDLDQLIGPVYSRYTNPVTTLLASPGEIQIHLRARCRDQEEAGQMVAELAAQMAEVLGDRVYSMRGESLEAVTGRLLKERGATLSVAESCTGGLLAGRITSVPGSSEWFRGGFLVYTDQMKSALLGIDPALLAVHGAVSPAVAGAMAAAARERTGSTYALSVTGYAGPDGGTGESPVGTVCIGLAGPGGVETLRRRLFGDRERVRTLAVVMALDWLRRLL